MPEDNVTSSDSISIAMRSYFSITYFRAAAALLANAGRLEVEYTEFDGNKHAEHQGAVVGSIMMSMAGIEAFINEFYSDCADSHAWYLTGMSEQSKERVANAWRESEVVERASVIEKYQLACTLTDRPLIPKGTAPLQDVAVGIAIRNALMHYKPQSVDLPFDGTQGETREDWRRVVKLIQSRSIKPNPFSTLAQPDFPYRLMSHACADWQLRSAQSLVRTFERHMGLQNSRFDGNLFIVNGLV